MKYKASLDTLAKIITGGVFISFIAIGLKNIIGLFSENGNLIYSILPVIFLAVLIGSWLYAPQSYAVNGTDLIINRPIGKVKIKRLEIKEVRILGEGEMDGSIRTFGSGGLFGYYGRYHNSRFGRMTLYTTQRKNRVLILTSYGQKIVISPDDLSIVEELRK